MSNEELVAAIQAGDRSKITELWCQCEKFVRMMAEKWERAFENKTRCDSEDLYQSGFFALEKAVNGYQPDKGLKFIGYLVMHLKTEFSKAAGVLTVSQRKAPENNSKSLSEPMIGKAGAEDFFFEDVIRSDGLPQDEPEAGEILEIMERDCDLCLKQAVHEAVAGLPEKQATAINACFFQNLTQKEAGETMGLSGQRVSYLCEKGIREIKRGETGAKLREMLFENRDYYAYTGLNAWRMTGMSVQERQIIRKETIMEKMERQEKKKSFQ